MPEEPLQPHCKERGKNTVREKRRNELKRFGVFKNFNECTSSYVLHMIRCICKTSDKTQLLNHFHQDRKIYLAYCAQQERLQRYLASPCWDSFLRHVSHTLNIHAEGSLYATATEWGKGYLLQMWCEAGLLMSSVEAAREAGPDEKCMRVTFIWHRRQQRKEHFESFTAMTCLAQTV